MLTKVTCHYFTPYRTVFLFCLENIFMWTYYFLTFYNKNHKLIYLFSILNLIIDKFLFHWNRSIFCFYFFFQTCCFGYLYKPVPKQIKPFLLCCSSSYDLWHWTLQLLVIFSAFQVHSLLRSPCSCPNSSSGWKIFTPAQGFHLS